jgi:chromosome segregation ATPase
VEGRAAAATAAAESERAELLKQVAVLTDQAHTATARVQEIEKRAEDLKASLTVAQGAAATLTRELEAERGQHGATREAASAANAELVKVKARAEAQAGVQAEQAERLKRVEAELVQVRESAAAAREEAAQLRGQAEALKLQQAQLLEAITTRDGERPAAPKGGKK